MQSKKPFIALTGGYASGKSLVLSRFQMRGYSTFSADKIYADLLENENFVDEISGLVGVSFKIENNKKVLDRSAVASVCFSDAEKLQKLNNFTHEKVYGEIYKLFNQSKNNKLIFEIPLLFESKKENDFDEVIVVLRNRSKRISFGAKRDNISEDEAVKRIINQFDYDNCQLSAHTYIYNNGSVNELYAEVDAVIERLESKYFS